MLEDPRIPDDLAAFLESGIAIVAATRDGDLQADGAVAWAAKVHEGGASLTVYFHEQAAREMQRNLGAHPEIALDFDQPSTHRACQVKGRCTGSRPAREDERALVTRQVEGFANELEKIGIARTVATAWSTWPCTAIDVKVAQLFEQTPFPGTGGPLGR